MHIRHHRKRPIRLTLGFTIVELLIVVVVIAILATISVVAYTGIQNRARSSAASAAVGQITRKIDLYRVENSESYPDSLSALGISNTANETYQYVVNNSTSPKVWCAAVTVGEKTYYASSNQKTPAEGSCLGGGGGNISPSLTYWMQSGAGGATYDSGSGELVLSKAASGSYISPIIDVDGSTSYTLSFQIYPSSASPNFTPKGGAYTGTRYFASDGVTPVQNTTGNTTNGNARGYDLNTWSTYTATFVTGPNVKKTQVLIHSSPTTYTGDARIKDVSITINQ